LFGVRSSDFFGKSVGVIEGSEDVLEFADSRRGSGIGRPKLRARKVATMRVRRIERVGIIMTWRDRSRVISDAAIHLRYEMVGGVGLLGSIDGCIGSRRTCKRDGAFAFWMRVAPDAIVHNLEGGRGGNRGNFGGWGKKEKQWIYC
jgi:hypothetical protein